MRKVFLVRDACSLASCVCACELWGDAYDMASAVNPRHAEESERDYEERVRSLIDERPMVEGVEHGRA